VQSEDELTEFLAPLVEVVEKKEISPNRSIEILFDIMRRLAMIQQRVDRPTLETCMKVDMLKVFEMEKDQPAALPDGEGVGTDEELHQAYISALSDRDHVVAVLAAWIDAQEKRLRSRLMMLLRGICRPTSLTVLLVVQMPL